MTTLATSRIAWRSLAHDCVGSLQNDGSHADAAAYESDMLHVDVSVRYWLVGCDCESCVLSRGANDDP